MSSYKEIKSISEAYRSMHTNASVLAHEINKMRDQDMGDIWNLIEKIGLYNEKVYRDTGDRPIRSRDYEKVGRAMADLNNVLRDIEDTMRRQ